MPNIEIGDSGRIKGIGKLTSGLTEQHINSAIESYDLLGGQVDTYEQSTTYDLVVDGKRYPPKTIFGLAASRLLGFEVKSSHFTGGEDSPCFFALERLGFEIKTKVVRPGLSEGLRLYGRYDRQQVCEIFSPGAKFSIGAGVWGLQGIVRDAPCPNDFVLFVTLEQRDGNDYEDALTEDGVLVWKSQNRHTPESPVVRKLVSHDAARNNVYLFLRGNGRDAYTYLGPIAFRDWDPLSARPVHFTWTILNWPLPEGLADSVNVKLKPALTPTYSAGRVQIAEGGLAEVAPTARRRGGRGRTTSAVTPDWAEREQRNRELGLAGEHLVLQFERAQLIEAGKMELAELVEHVAQVDSAAGYDIKSFDPETGEQRYIEVKTTTASMHTPFFISRNEVEVSSGLGDAYWIYRVFDYSANEGQANFYRRCGAVEDSFELCATSYSAVPSVSR